MSDDFPPPNSDEPPAPFLSALSVELPADKQINLIQLTDELTKATGHQVHLALTGNAEGTVQTLAVTPGNLNPAVVKQVVGDHSPLSDYGVPEEEQAFAALLKQVHAGPVELTAEELNAAVVGLLRRVGAPTGRPRPGLLS